MKKTKFFKPVVNMKYLKYISPISIFIYVVKIPIICFVFGFFSIYIIKELVLVLLSFEYTEDNKEYIQEKTEIIKELIRSIIYKL